MLELLVFHCIIFYKIFLNFINFGSGVGIISEKKPFVFLSVSRRM